MNSRPVLAAILMCALAGVCRAGPYEDADAAFKSGTAVAVERLAQQAGMPLPKVSAADEERLQKELKVTIRCIPFDRPKEPGKCMVTGQPSAGRVVFAGVDYERILRAAEEEADVILWDGGNNDLPFYRPDVHVVVADPLRAGHELTYHPGETNLRMADVIIVNKMDSASPEQVSSLLATIGRVTPRATVIRADSAVRLDEPEVERLVRRRGA